MKQNDIPYFGMVYVKNTDLELYVVRKSTAMVMSGKCLHKNRICGLSIMTGPDSVMVRASASEVGGVGSNPGRVIPKTLKMVPVATLLGAQHS